MSMQPVPWPEPDPQIAAAIKAMYGSRKTERPLAAEIRDRLGQWLADEDFAAAFGIRGRPGWPPSRLALVTVLQRAEKLTDRLAAEAVRARLDWKYLLGLPVDDPGFDHTVLAEFRGKVAEAGLEQVALDALLGKLAGDGLVKAGGKQRTDSTHVVAAVAALNRLELAGESVRAAVEALAAAHPGWLAQRICVPDWTGRYGTPLTSWRPPVSQAKQDELAVAYARDGYALLEAVYAASSPAWLRELPAVDVLRRVLVQNYARTITGNGREVIKRREKEPEGDGLPPGHARIASPYDTDARWGVKREELWLGYKLHVTETCDDEPRCGCPGDGGTGRRRHDEDCPAPAFPNLITHVATTGATVTDNQMTAAIHDELTGKTLAPGRHYLDSGYLSAALVVSEAARHGIALIGPLLADTSAQARAAVGLGDVRVHETELPRLPADLARELAGLVVVRRLRCDLLLRELARQGAELLLLFRQGEIDHATPPRGADKETPPGGAGRPAAIDALLLLLPHLLRHLLLPLLAARVHLLWRHLLDVRGDAPVMTERIDDLAEAIPPEHVGDGHRHLRPRVHRLLDDGVDVRDVQKGRPGDAPRRLRRLVVGGHRKILVGQEDDRIADLDLGVHDLAAGPGHAEPGLGSERLLVELERLSGVALDQIRRDRVETIGDRLDVLRHGKSSFERGQGCARRPLDPTPALRRKATRLRRRERDRPPPAAPKRRATLTLGGASR